MKRCPSLQEWLELKEGRLGTKEVARLEAHRATGCNACASQWEWVQRVTASLSAGEGHRLSTESRGYLRELAASRIAPRERPQWITALLLDSRQQPALVGARGEAEALQLRYGIEDYEVRLWGETEGHHTWYLIGQVLSKSENNFRTPEEATLIRQTDARRIAGHQEETEFHLPDVGAGKYRLVLRLPEADLLIPEIVLE